jgi:stage III sporulation protein AB
LLILGTSAWGLLGVTRLRRRCRILAELARALGALRAELVTRLEPVPQLISLLSSRTREPVASLFRNVEARLPQLGETSFYDIWGQAVTATPELLLEPEEQRELREVPRALGRYDVEEQRVALERAERRFEEFSRRADEKRDADSKTRACIGVAAGVFLALILI